MSVFNLLRSKLLGIDPLSSLVNGFREISHSSALGFNATACLMAMPIKKKRKIDPAVLKIREERRKKKIEKEIKRLQKLTKSLKPIEETRIPICLYKNVEKRVRNIKVPDDEEEKRIEIKKEWSRISSAHNEIINKDIMGIILSQKIALDELRKESVELYNAAIQIDPHFLPFSFEGPSETPPIEDYDIPDGDYSDISKKWLNE